MRDLIAGNRNVKNNPPTILRTIRPDRHYDDVDDDDGDFGDDDNNNINDLILLVIT